VEQACQQAERASVDQLTELRDQLSGWRAELASGSVPAVVALELGPVLEQLELRLRQAERSVKKLAAEDQMKKAIGKTVCVFLYTF
jgi:anti-sigma-K factor RskA